METKIETNGGEAKLKHERTLTAATCKAHELGTVLFHLLVMLHEDQLEQEEL